MTTSVKTNFLPPSLISNLQQVLSTRNDAPEQRSHNAGTNSGKTPSSPLSESQKNGDRQKPVVLVTNAGGSDSTGLALLVEALRLDSRLDVCVCAPRVDKSLSGHAVTVLETISVCSAEIGGAVAYEVSGDDFTS
ncbi:hypothetical protein TIFTF001_022244 [Ficus carica]|uniref:Survival protein SurE-like phosphatase/nucleotidase domain-containing protein n=1 Tax=Ficus carica TaxID=3494 RepID=A0AA88AIA8_FICCA|nr:hypothetical protein TIFTF001_022244 [Ficus carica]